MSNLLKSKFFLGAVIVAVMFVGAVAVKATPAAADCSITSTLRVGSTGAQVVCLQTALGGLTADGSFGPKTKAAVVEWQEKSGLVADGVFGPKSNAVWMSNAGNSANFPVGCNSAVGFSPSTGLPCNGAVSGNFPAGCTSTAGFSPTTGMACSVTSNLPAGCSSTAGFSPTTGASCATGVVVVGTTGQGSATLDYEAIPAAGVSIYTGASQTPGVTFKIKATGSAMTVNSLALDVNDRIWLDASVAYLMQGSTVLATVPLNASTVTEVTTGSLWRIMFSGFSVVAPAGVNTDLTVAFDRPTVTQNNNTVQIQVSSYVRATDGTGFTTNVALAAGNTRNMSFSAAAATKGTLTTGLSSTAPLAGSVSGLSATVSVLTPVKLMDFDLKGTNSQITVTNLYGTYTSSGSIALSNEVASLELRDGATVLASVSGVNTGLATFTSLNVIVPKDGTKTLSIWAQMNPIGATGAGYTTKGDGITFTVVPYLDATCSTTACTKAYDANFNTVIDSTVSVPGNTQYMYQYAPTITMGTTSATPTTNGASISADFVLPFTVTAPSGQNIWVYGGTNGTISQGADGNDGAQKAENNVVVVKTTAGNGGNVANTIVASTTSGTDTATYFLVLAGQSRTFTVYSHVPVGGASGYTGVKLYKVYWALDGAGTGAQAQTWGLQNYNTASAYVTLN